MNFEHEKQLDAAGKRGLNGYWKAFLYGLAISFCIFLPFLIVDKGYFLYYGDFNVQQVPFYQMCHDAIRSGNVRWSWTTDLGANFVGSYSFYLLGSPFFWLTIPFPSKAVPYLMAPLLMLKFACASLAGFTFLRRYVRREESAILGALLYAFSGFSIYNVFFNHFHEAIISFPFLLAALDEYMYTRRRGVFALAVFACCFVNYYFFVGQVTFCLIYWFLRMFSRSWEIRLRDFLLLFFEAVVGVLLSCVLLIPSVLAVLQNPRVSNAPMGWNALIYNKNQRYLHILECFFFPPDIPARPNFTPDSESKWASLGAWLPLFSMTGVIAWLQQRRKHWLKKLLYVLFAMALVPLLNSMFQLFNASYYARWFYMLTLMMALATVMALERPGVDWKRAICWTTVITLCIALPIGLMPHESDDIKDIHGNPVVLYGLEQYPTRFWSYVAIALFCLFLLSILFAFFRKHRKIFFRITIWSVSFLSILYSIFVISLGKTQSEAANVHLIPYALNNGEDLDLPGDLQNVRSDFYDSMDNSAMYWQIPSIQAFHSIVPGSIMEFYPSIDVTRDVGSRADTTHVGLRALTSCRWLFDDMDDDAYFGGEKKDSPLMPGWTYYDTQNGFDIWENEYYIPMGFSYRYYVTPEQYEETPKTDREQLLLKAMVLSDEQAKKYASCISPLPDFGTYHYSDAEYFADCLTLQAASCSSFSHDNTGFTAEISALSSELVFFSVPYESGWTATVNGEPVDVEKVSVGFMAVQVPAGDNTIRFEYETPGLKLGLLVSAGALLLLLFYLFLARRLRLDRTFTPAGYFRSPYHCKPFSVYKQACHCQFPDSSAALAEPTEKERSDTL